MEMQELEIVIPRDGTVRVTVRGTTGDRCLPVTEGLEKAAGTVTERTFTPSYYEKTEHEKVLLGTRR
jgi:hypothetical protein